MARYAANAPTNFELPAPICVCALLVAGALTKGGHPHWAIGAPIFLYILPLAAQRVMIPLGYMSKPRVRNTPGDSP
jgi:hypothetical protein